MLKSNNTPYMAYKAEQDLLTAITDTKFGVIENAEVVVDPVSPKSLLMLSMAQIVLLDFIRDGNTALNKITVHAGQPIEVEVRSMVRGYSTVKKIRL